VIAFIGILRVWWDSNDTLMLGILMSLSFFGVFETASQTPPWSSSKKLKSVKHLFRCSHNTGWLKNVEPSWKTWNEAVPNTSLSTNFTWSCESFLEKAEFLGSTCHTLRMGPTIWVCSVQLQLQLQLFLEKLYQTLFRSSYFLAMKLCFPLTTFQHKYQHKLNFSINKQGVRRRNYFN
jgi:hypothetical protein